MSIYTFYDIRTEYIEIKFNQILDADSLSNDKFVLYNTTTGTPTTVSSPFKTIDVTRDFYSVSRTLILYWDIQLENDSTYSLELTNLVTIDDATPSSSTIEFETTTLIYPEDEASLIPTRAPVDVEDYSIKSISNLLVDTTSIDADKLVIIKTVPEIDKSYYLQSTENEGRIEIWFNQAPAANYVNNTYFKIQRKQVSKSLSRWEDVSAQIAANTAKAIVFIYLPSLDATPVFAYQVEKADEHEYFESGYKYRVLVSKDIGI